MNRLDHRSNSMSNWEASPAMGPFFQGVGDLLATIDYIEVEGSKGIHFLEKQRN